VPRHAVEPKRLSSLEKRLSLLNRPLQILFGVYPNAFPARDDIYYREMMKRPSESLSAVPVPAGAGKVTAVEVHLLEILTPGKTAPQYRGTIVLYDSTKALLSCLLVTSSTKLLEGWQELETDAKKEPSITASAGTSCKATSAILMLESPPIDLERGSGNPELSVSVRGQDTPQVVPEILDDWKLDDGYEPDWDSDDPDGFWEWDQTLEKWKHLDGDTGKWVFCPDSLD